MAQKINATLREILSEKEMERLEKLPEIQRILKLTEKIIPTNSLPVKRRDVYDFQPSYGWFLDIPDYRRR